VVRASLWLGLVTACGFSPALGGDGVDAPDPLGDCTTWHPHDFTPCAIGVPQGPVHLVPDGTPYVYDTSQDGGVLTDKTGAEVLRSPLTHTQSDGSVVALLSIESLTIDANVRWNVIGTKPLVVASWSTIDIAGALDVGSHTTDTDATTHIQVSTTVGAGADLDCGNMNGAPGVAATADGGSGGGGGGAFQGAGGGGGSGDTGCNAMLPCPRPGGPGGVPLATAPTTIRGGCGGGASGTAGDGATAPATAATVSQGGSGGGALELDARLAVHVAATGTVSAGGGGGAGAPMHTAAGGGGGGSGGFVGLDAPIVMVFGTVAANGGGGGASSPFTGGIGYGFPGADGAASATPAAGGLAAQPPATCGKPGADGSAGAMLAGAMLTAFDSCGGSGAGGGAGFILYWSAAYQPAAGSTVSPDALAGVL